MNIEDDITVSEDGKATLYLELEDDLRAELQVLADTAGMALEDYMAMIIEEMLAEEIARATEAGQL